jgi:GcrA cell cycle regulator
MWASERIAQVEQMWRDGRTATQIAAEIGGVTRNAIIGLVHRLRLSGKALANRSRSPVPETAPRPKRSITLAKLGYGAPQLCPHPAAGLPAEQRRASWRGNLAAPESRPCGLLELQHDSCRWPLGDPSSPEFRFCGGRADEDRSYCAFHGRLAYQPRRS